MMQKNGSICCFPMLTTIVLVAQTWISAAHAAEEAARVKFTAQPALTQKSGKAERYSAFAVAFSPDGKTLFTSGSNSISVWDFAEGKLLREYTGHTKGVICLAVSPDGRTFASGSWDKTVRLWNSEREELLHTLTGNRGQLRYVVFSPNGKHLTSVSAFNEVKIWEVATGQKLLEWDTSNDRYETFLPWFDAKGQLQVIANHLGDDAKLRGIGTLDIKTRDYKRKLATMHNLVNGPCAASGNGKHVLTISRENVHVWTRSSGRVLREFRRPGDLFATALSPNAKLVAWSGTDFHVHVFDVSKGNELFSHNFRGIIDSVTFSPDGKQMVVGHQDGEGGIIIDAWRID